jgi:nitrite reductase/ring-hydroxylating ferredoxin subunit
VAVVRVTVARVDDLQKKGCIAAKVGSQPLCVLWHEGTAYAVDDRCPHMGFPLHRGTVEHGLLTCHWHHARFDLASGGTLDPFADDVRAYPVEIADGDVVVVVENAPDRTEHHLRRLHDGLEQGLTLVAAKAVLALVESGLPTGEIVKVGVEFGTTFRQAGWSAGLTVLTAMANVLPHLEPDDRPLALVHGLAFVSRDTRGRPPWFPLSPLDAPQLPLDRLSSWYRRFVDTRTADAAERVLATAIAAGQPLDALACLMTAAVTDHVFIDEGHTLDFTNKAFEVLEHLGSSAVARVLPTLVAQTASARRHEEEGPWRHPHDLAAIVERATGELPARLAMAAETTRTFDGDKAVAALGWDILGEEPEDVVRSLDHAVDAGATAEEMGRAVAYAAALRITRFHTQNDHGDWDVVHHAFTTANACHQALIRAASPELLRGVYHGALRVWLDRFLNVPAARLPSATNGPIEPAAFERCWDEQGRVDEAGSLAYGWLRQGGDAAHLVSLLGHALLLEDAEFHWFQTYEAAVRQFHAWPTGSEEGALVLVGMARFLAAHTPTRRERAQVMRIATRLRRGEAVYEAE